MENSAENENNTPSETYKKIIALIIKYGTLSLILESGCNSVFRTDKYMLNVSILKYFIENIKCILQNEDKDENIKYNSIKIFIDKFILYIERKKRNPVSRVNFKKTFCKTTNIENFIQCYSSDDFKTYKIQFIEMFHEYEF
jgi:hypothetical protein